MAILDDITSLDGTKKIMRDKKGLTSMGLEKDNPWEKGNQTKDAEKDSFSTHLAIQQVGLHVDKTFSKDNIMTCELKVYSVITIHLWILVNLSQLSSKSTIMLCL